MCHDVPRHSTLFCFPQMVSSTVRTQTAARTRSVVTGVSVRPSQIPLRSSSASSLQAASHPSLNTSGSSLRKTAFNVQRLSMRSVRGEMRTQIRRNLVLNCQTILIGFSAFYSVWNLLNSDGFNAILSQWKLLNSYGFNATVLLEFIKFLWVKCHQNLLNSSGFNVYYGFNFIFCEYNLLNSYGLMSFFSLEFTECFLV